MALKGPATGVLWIAVGLLTLAVAGLTVFVYQLLAQQGRLLLRIDALEQKAPGRSDPPGSTCVAGVCSEAAA